MIKSEGKGSGKTALFFLFSLFEYTQQAGSQEGRQPLCQFPFRRNGITATPFDKWGGCVVEFRHGRPFDKVRNRE